jgi:type II secretory ATPase GspE/PulE/Tfp pilus assembly ATPase PilB-like protein
MGYIVCRICEAIWDERDFNSLEEDDRRKLMEGKGCPSCKTELKYRIREVRQAQSNLQELIAAFKEFKFSAGISDIIDDQDLQLLYIKLKEFMVRLYRKESILVERARKLGIDTSTL